MRARRCLRSWVTIIIIIVGLLIIGNLLFSSMLPKSLVYKMQFQQMNNTYVYLSNSEGAVRFRGAPWKAQIGTWLSGCHLTSTPIHVSENIHGKECKDNCNSRGVCNRELGECRCFSGFAGEGCGEEVKLECNLPALPNMPNGPWIFSLCAPGHCDTTRAKCYCGEGTAYPNRPLIHHCGFKFGETAGSGVDWGKVDEDVFTTNVSKRGWCNVDPKEAYEGRTNYKKHCDCRYDGYHGIFGERPCEFFCVNQCSGHGHCHDGACHCDGGWYGIDCSIPSSECPPKHWPKWLRPSSSKVKVLESDDEGPRKETVVQRRRPLIYVYDLPPEFNTHFLERRLDRSHCSHRLYDDRNRTNWNNLYYGGQTALHESLLSSPHRTMNGEEADYFYVPMLDSCSTFQANESPHFSTSKFLGSRCFLSMDMYKRAYGHIVDRYSYWNRSSGRDHIWYFSWDEGACCAPKEIRNSLILTHFGNTNTKHNQSTTAYGPDSWDNIPLERRGNHTCFDPAKDLIIPSWKSPETILREIQEARLHNATIFKPRAQRKTLFYFNGNLGAAYNGRPEEKYSIGIRQKVAEEFCSTPDKDGRLGKQRVDDVIIAPQRSPNYGEELGSSIFCGVFPGDGWSGRMEDSILHGCIPVIIQDGIYLPYENVFDFETFVVRIAEDDIPNMVNILRAINETKIDSMIENIRSLWQRFLYRDSIVLEATRQERAHGSMEAWGTEFAKLKEDDAFSTIIQILHYKLHNDPWRLNPYDRKKDYGLPEECLR